MKIIKHSKSRGQRKKVFLRWLWVAVCIAAVYLIVPLARTIRQFVSERWGRALFGYAVLSVTAVSLVAVITLLFFRLKVRRMSQYIWLGLVAAAYFYFTLRLKDAPEEAIHFLEYGLLGFFLFRAISLTVKDKTIYLDGLFIGAIVGFFDEVIQWMIPDRYWDLRDVGLNALAVGLFQLALWKGIKPRIISDKIRPASLRKSSIWLAVFLVLIGLSMSNTPQRVASYTKKFPSLSFLNSQEAMSELTYRHRDPEIGLFYSRLTLVELAKQDRERSVEFGGVLHHWKEKDYKTFLRFFPSSVHPFLYEFRVHAFRRDRYLKRAQTVGNPVKAGEFYNIAVKENLILEKYFGHTLNRSPYSWDPEKTLSATEKAEPESFYKSPVGARIFAGIREGTIWAVILVFLLLLAAAHLIWGHFRRFA
ncbi:MAG: VanZ family protein [Candidatus Aminicenantes bacterium]|nr:VanZ family protein [Candidatus Aminicenantes bacterium]